MSNMKETRSHLNDRIAERVRELRTKQALSLDALARKSGVSRSMLSVIERGESSPTAVILERIAGGLGIPLSSLFETTGDVAKTLNSPVSLRQDQLEWVDPESGYVRRNVSPPGGSQPMRLVEVQFPAGARVAFEGVARNATVYQQIWVLDGKMDITVDKERYRLCAGDCLAMQLDHPIVFHNPTRAPARYVVVVAS
jgi:transcriptional regulator with XRE-family HTH domain